MGETGQLGEFQAPPVERRYSPVEVEGRNLRGVVIQYGDVARMPFGRETFERGAFGDVSGLDVRLNVQHNRDRLIARTPQTLTLTDGPDALRMAATLPETREADDALAAVRAGLLRGLSLEFRAVRAPFVDGLRTIRKATLRAFGLVDTPAYAGSTVEARAYEIRQDGDGLEGRFFYDVDTVVSDRAAVEERRRDGVRKQRVRPRAFSFAIDAPDREIQLLAGRSFDNPLGSKLAGTLELVDTPEFLGFRVETLPDTQAARDLRAAITSRAAVPGVVPYFNIPPPEAVPGAVEIVEEVGNPGVNVEVVNQAVLTALAVVFRRPRGNPGEVARRRRVWL